MPLAVFFQAFLHFFKAAPCPLQAFLNCFQAFWHPSRPKICAKRPRKIGETSIPMLATPCPRARKLKTYNRSLTDLAALY